MIAQVAIDCMESALMTVPLKPFRKPSASADLPWRRSCD